MMNTDLSSRIIQCAYTVHNTLGQGFLEKVYENALLHELSSNGFTVFQQQNVRVTYRDKIVGDYFCDLLIERRMIIELKAVSTLAPEHSAQVINYLKAGVIKDALLFNFGSAKLQVKRLHG